MTAEGHLFFSIACAVFAKNAELTSALVQGDWWHILSSAVLTCLLPDIDHPKSFLGQRLRWISKPIAQIFGHRGFTHSILGMSSVLMLFYLQASNSWMVPIDVIHGMVLGYISHILADMLTSAGVPLLWPCRWRFCLPILALKKGNKLERILCMSLFTFSIWMPESFPETAVSCSSQIIKILQFQFNRFISH